MNVAVEVIDQLKSDGRVSRGYLGVQGGEVSSDLAKALGMKKPVGAHIRSVLDGGAADKSGILPGDVILAIDDDEVVYFKDLQHTIGRTKPNTEVVAQLFREGSLLYLDVTVGELPVEETQAETSIKEQESAFPLGLRLEELETGEQKGLRVLHKSLLLFLNKVYHVSGPEGVMTRILTSGTMVLFIAIVLLVVLGLILF